MMKLDCLIALKRYQEAMEVYKQVVVQYFEEQGLPPSETMLQRFRLMSGQIRTPYFLVDEKRLIQNLEKRGKKPRDRITVHILHLLTVTVW